MTFQVFPTPSVVSGDPASQTFGATTSGTFILSTALAAGVYEITTDTVQSSFTLGLADADGIRYTGTIRGGKGYISVATPVTRIVVPAGMTYPVNINIRLGAYTQIAAPTSASFNWVANTGANVTFTFTAPAGATAIVAYWRDGTSTTLASTSSPSASVAIPGTYSAGNSGFAVLVARDANGNTGLGVSLTTTGTYVNPTIMGGTATVYTSGSTSYLVNTFTGSGTLTVNTTANLEFFVVAGGGPGGCSNEGGGGGGGGSTSATRTSVAVGSYTVTVGAGGVGHTTNEAYGTNGGTSTVSTTSAITVAGGGAGGMYAGVTNTRVPGQAGGCGGGGSMGYGASNLSGGTASAGFAGGNGQNYGGGWNGGGGGGGGGSAAGANCVTGVSGDGGNGNAMGRAGVGGNGVSNSLRTGSAVVYAGGGGGRSSNLIYGNVSGGTGGGTASASGNSLAAAANTGGGSGASPSQPGNGGSGIVVVRVAI
jgi:hypothetical protein